MKTNHIYRATVEHYGIWKAVLNKQVLVATKRESMPFAIAAVERQVKSGPDALTSPVIKRIEYLGPISTV